MDYLKRITHKYRGNILLNTPYKGKKSENIPEELYSILCISDGILETMRLSDNDERIAIGWIIYSHDEILKWTAFYAANYSIEGTVFSGDGAGSPYIIKWDGRITCFDVIDNEETEIADTLSDFFQ